MRTSLSVLQLLLFANICTAQFNATIFSENVGIETLSFETTSDFNFVEMDMVWSNDGQGLISLDNLEPTVPYFLTVNVTNNSDVEWESLAIEIFDIAGGVNDIFNDVMPYPDFVPDGWSTSNNDDGLSFNQPGVQDFTSVQFDSFRLDQKTDRRDFLDYFDGTIAGNGGNDTLTFELIDLKGPIFNQPFLLSFRPNEFSTSVPEPCSATLFLASGLGITLSRRRS